ncbi:hypothetical protein C8J56DRAFT_1166602 [Mycena floridula]|nr:hypothetical protein C8J56DRAFT_1166602 [Mycena floridula]
MRWVFRLLSYCLFALLFTLIPYKPRSLTSIPEHNVASFIPHYLAIYLSIIPRASVPTSIPSSPSSASSIPCDTIHSNTLSSISPVTGEMTSEGLTPLPSVQTLSRRGSPIRTSDLLMMPARGCADVGFWCILRLPVLVSGERRKATKTKEAAKEKQQAKETEKSLAKTTEKRPTKTNEKRQKKGAR